MNIVLIVIDTLRYDALGVNGNERAHTPNIDRLAASGWAFDNAYSASFPTIPFRNDAMRGEYGGPFHPWKPLPFNALTFPETLGKNGYATQLIHDTPHLVNGGHNFDWPFHAWTFIRGAEVDRPWITDGLPMLSNWTRDPLFDVGGELKPAPGLRTYMRANRHRKDPDDWNCAQLFHTAAQFLRGNAERDNFFLWIDCFDPHEPWDAPPEFMRMFDQTPGYDGRIDPRSFQARNNPNLSEAGRRRVQASYEAKTAWVDHCFGKFLTALEETGLDEKTAVILMADHGTNLGERGFFGKRSPVTDAEAHVPLIIKAPGAGSGRSSVLVQPQDLFATVLGLAGIPLEADLDSHNVLEAAQKGEGRRQIALAGGAANQWQRRQNGTLFTAFDGEWGLQVAADPEKSVLGRIGSVENETEAHAETGANLREAAIEEIARRGLDEPLAEWLRSDGQKQFPQDASFWRGWPDRSGHHAYFSRLYGGD